MSLDLAPALRAAILGDASIISLLSDWNGSPAVHTRRPVPSDSTYPMIVINPDSGIGDEDGINSPRPVVLRDVNAYGLKPNDYRSVEAIGYALRALFHRQKGALVIDGYRVINILAAGPFAVGPDDEQIVARAVSLTVSVQPSS